MIERLQNITAKYQELVEELTHEDVLQDYNKLRKLSKEKADLEEIVLKYKEYPFLHIAAQWSCNLLVYR